MQPEKMAQLRMAQQVHLPPQALLHPYMSPLDYWFWSVCLAELRRSPPTTMEELITTMEDIKNSIEEQDVRGACRSILHRAQDCIEAEGGTFEHMLKKARQPIKE